MAGEEGCFNELLELQGCGSGQIILKDPDDPKWRGRTKYIKETFRRFIGYGRELDVLPSWLPPVYVGVADLNGALDGIEKYGYCIFIATHMMYASDTALARLIAHEFAHALKPEHDHDDVWRWHYEALWLMHTHGEYTSA